MLVKHLRHASQRTKVVLVFLASAGLLYYCLTTLSFTSPLPRLRMLPPVSSNIASGRFASTGPPEQGYDGGGSPSSINEDKNALDTVQMMSHYFTNNPLNLTRPKEAFSDVGQRVEALVKLMSLSESIRNPQDRDEARGYAEAFALSLFPFLKNPKGGGSGHPLHDLRSGYVKGSRGLVIPCGKGNARFAVHLVAAVRGVLRSGLPVEVAYAGEADLPAAYRRALEGFGGVTFTDVTAVFDDGTLKLAEGGWAIKPFAALASRFEQVVLVDADCVFLQPPEAMLDSHSAYEETGALLFHDRLLWKGRFKERHDWWEGQMKGRKPSAALLKSLVWTEGYAEEGDSGVVVVDKSRPAVVGALLHVCWQNTARVRDEVTYKITYGDKESWWFGFELAGAPYSFEENYGGIAGREKRVAFNVTTGKDAEGNKVEELTEETRVCSFNIAHPDEKGRLLWWNGGLLKNKAVDQEEFEVPTHFVVNGLWHKGGAKRDTSCVAGGKKVELDDSEVDIITRTVELAKKADEKFRTLFELDKKTAR